MSKGQYNTKAKTFFRFKNDSFVYLAGFFAIYIYAKAFCISS